MSEKRKVFRIGIAMAGAVSAGAYTAGVMDYLLETLSKWENAKERNQQLSKDDPRYDPSVPDHDVIIEVIGGSSAGGMTAAITALSLFEGLRPVNKDNPDKEGNKLYDAWVRLNDEYGDGKPTLLQMFQTDDIFDEDGVVSILNSKPIDAIAQRAGNLSRINKLPDYISPSLEVILTITSLRGIPLSISFYEEAKKLRSMGKEPKPAHKMNLHKGIAHFRVLQDGEGLPSHIIPLRPESEADKQALLDSAIATGAFPFGLAPRQLRGIPTPYVKSMVQRMFAKSVQGNESKGEKIASNSLNIGVEGPDFNFFAVDGGAVNNEPFGEVIRALDEKGIDLEEKNYAILMIDPFPNFEPEEEKSRDTPPKLIELAPKVLGAIRGQAMMKEGDLIEGLSENHTLRMVFPSRRNGEDKDPYPICCGALGGFGGFFSREFREHDFELGRRNCQSFLRKHFCIPLERAETMSVFEGWDANDPRHRRFYSKEVNGYPIIPDMDYDPVRLGDTQLVYPEKKGITPEEIFALEPPLYNRLKEVLINIDKYDKPEVTSDTRKINQQVESIMRKHYRISTWKQIRSDLFGYSGKLMWKYIGSAKLATMFTRSAIRSILTDFKRQGLLKDDK